jgi:hypothetical protein
MSGVERLVQYKDKGTQRYTNDTLKAARKGKNA